ARLQQVAVAVVVERDLALQDVEEPQVARLEDDLLGREAARLRTERRDHRADLSLEEAGAEYGPPLGRPSERHHRVVALVRDDDAAGGLAVEERGDRHAEGRGDLAEGVERGREPADSICETMLGVRPAFSASWRCCSSRSPRSR